MNRIRAFIRKIPQSCPAPSTMERHSEKSASCKRALTQTRLQNCEKCISAIYRLPSQWIFVTVARRDQDTNSEALFVITKRGKSNPNIYLQVNRELKVEYYSAFKKGRKF